MPYYNRGRRVSKWRQAQLSISYPPCQQGGSAIKPTSQKVIKKGKPTKRLFHNRLLLPNRGGLYQALKEFSSSEQSFYLFGLHDQGNVFCKLRWIDLRYRASSLYQLMLRQCLIWVCSCPKQLRGSHRSITAVSTTELAYAPLWSSAISIKKIIE